MSASLPWRTAASMPSGTAITSMTRMAATANSSERPSAVSISGPTGWPVRIDRPKSPVAAWPTQRRYCHQIGSPNPRRSRIAFSASAVAFSPSRVTAASAGSAWVMPKTSTDTMKTV